MYDILWEFLSHCPNVFIDATIIFKICLPSLYKEATLSFISLLNSKINSKKKSDSSASSSTILNLFAKSALDLALFVAL